MQIAESYYNNLQNCNLKKPLKSHHVTDKYAEGRQQFNSLTSLRKQTYFDTQNQNKASCTTSRRFFYCFKEMFDENHSHNIQSLSVKAELFKLKKRNVASSSDTLTRTIRTRFPWTLHWLCLSTVVSHSKNIVGWKSIMLCFPSFTKLPTVVIFCTSSDAVSCLGCSFWALTHWWPWKQYAGTENFQKSGIFIK